MPKVETYQDGKLIDTIDTRSADDARADAMNRIDVAYASALAVGAVVNGITFSMDDDSRSKFHQLITLLNILGASAPASIQISDINGSLHAMSPSDFISAMALYGGAIMAIEQKRLALRAAALAVTSNDQADAIAW